MKVLVCGSRAAKDQDAAWAALDEIQGWTVHDAERVMGMVFACTWEKYGPISCVVTGSASGRDTHAEKWAKAREIAYRGHPAPWRTHGAWCRCRAPRPVICKAAGPWRNAEMLRREDVAAFPVALCIAFPGGAGTRSMVELARAAGIVVREVG